MIFEYNASVLLGLACFCIGLLFCLFFMLWIDRLVDASIGTVALCFGCSSNLVFLLLCGTYDLFCRSGALFYGYGVVLGMFTWFSCLSFAGTPCNATTLTCADWTVEPLPTLTPSMPICSVVSFGTWPRCHFLM